MTTSIRFLLPALFVAVSCLATRADEPARLKAEPALQPLNAPCADCGPRHAHHGRACDRCGGQGCNHCGGLLASHHNGGDPHLLAKLYHRRVATVHSGQPFIDPYMRADWIAAQRAAQQSWHAGYYHTAWGAPVALVVPPTVQMHTRYSWGVNQTRMEPLYQQFERPDPGPVGGEAGMMMVNPLQPTPRWPSHTDQFGVYYVRGPW
jgi:hypothetical protein